MNIKLNYVDLPDCTGFESILVQRQTVRDFSHQALAIEQLSRLLFAAQGQRPGSSKRTAPSAQEQYPLSTVVVVNRVKELAAGLYRYDGLNHTLEVLSTKVLADQLSQVAIGDQPWVEQSSVVIVLMGDIESMNRHFAAQPPRSQRGERYVYIEAGAVAQNIHLQATTLGLGMVLVGGFDNEQVKQILNQPTELEPLALLCVGKI